MCLFVLDNVRGYASRDVAFFLVLTKIFHKIAVGVHQVHDDGVVHLGQEGELSCLACNLCPT